MTTLAGVLSNSSSLDKWIWDEHSIESIGKLTQLHYSAAGTNHVSGCRKMGESSTYFVPSGKRFLVLGLLFETLAGAGQNRIGLVPATTDPGFAAASLPADGDFGTTYVETVGYQLAAVESRKFSYITLIPEGKCVVFSCNPSGGTNPTARGRVLGVELSSNEDAISTLNDIFNIGNALIKSPGKRTFKVLHGWASAGKWFTPKVVGGSAYQVPTGKKFVVVGHWTNTTAGATTLIGGLETATANVGMDSASAAAGADNGGSIPFGFGIAANDRDTKRGPYPLVVPASKFLHGHNNAGQSCTTIYGFEVDADATVF